MNRTTTATEVVDKVLQEHEVLREKVHRIHSVLTRPAPARDEMESLLREFLNALVVHFSNEENEGFFEDVTTHAPRLAARADKLCIEHKQLLREAGELCRFASAGSPSMQWWRELKSRCHELSKKLMVHESEENKLLQQAHLDDVGVYD